ASRMAGAGGPAGRPRGRDRPRDLDAPEEAARCEIMTADQALLEALAALERALEASGAPHMLIGGLAVIARGVARQTTDVDATVLGERLHLEVLIAHLGREGISPRIPDALAFARDRQVL